MAMIDISKMQITPNGINYMLQNKQMRKIER